MLALSYVVVIQGQLLAKDIMEKTTITKKEYDELMEAKSLLEALQEAGVDDWSGYEYAQEILGKRS